MLVAVVVKSGSGRMSAIASDSSDSPYQTDAPVELAAFLAVLRMTVTDLCTP